MELFNHRRLGLGCVMFLITLFISYYLNSTIKLATLVLAGVAFAFLLIICAVKRTNWIINALIHITAPILCVCIAIIVSIFTFDSDALSPYYEKEDVPFKGTIAEVIYTDDDVGFYLVNLHRVEENQISAKAELSIHGKPLNEGDVIEAAGSFSKIEKATVGFDHRAYRLSQNIHATIECDSYTYIESEPMLIQSILHKTNSFLDNRLRASKSDTTYSLLTALFLGNKSELSQSVKRDFTRIGLSHALALSGMHITIIVTVLSFALNALQIPRRAKNLLLVFATLFFVALTGFSNSAIRAGIMLSLVHILQLIGRRVSTESALLFSVTIICIVNPFSIFSTSLVLSFFAMQGCLISAKIIHSTRLFRKIRLKPLRYILASLISSLFAMSFTLPVIFIVFGNVAVLSPLTNLLISPIITLLIYLAPLYILVSSVPYLGPCVDWLCTKLTDATVFLCTKCASLDNILVPIISKIQALGVLLLTISVVALLIVKQKHLIHTVCCILLGALLFTIGSLITSHNSSSSVYLTAYSDTGGDFLVVEDEGKVTAIDISKTNNSTAFTALGVFSHIGCYEIDTYVFTNYSSNSLSSVNSIVCQAVVREIILPVPLSDDEKSMAKNIEQAVQEMNISVSYLESEIKTQSTTIKFAKANTLGHSNLRSTALTVQCGDTLVAYLGASSYELCDYFIEDSVFQADGIIFGSYGPKYTVQYDYEAPQLDACVFFGESYSFASEGIKQLVSQCIIEQKGYPLRFKLAK